MANQLPPSDLEDAMAETLPPPPLSLPQWAQVFKMLGDEIRLRLLLLLAESGPLSVSALCVAADQTQATVSHHLMLMRMSSLVGFRRVGRNNLYFVASDDARELLRCIHRDESESFVEA